MTERHSQCQRDLLAPAEIAGAVIGAEHGEQRPAAAEVERDQEIGAAAQHLGRALAEDDIDGPACDDSMNRTGSANDVDDAPGSLGHSIILPIVWGGVPSPARSSSPGIRPCLPSILPAAIAIPET